MFFSLNHLEALLSSYKYLLLFPIAIFEGPIVTMIAGFLLSQGYLSFWPAYLTIVVGDEIGDLLHYAVGYFGGVRFVKKFGRYIGVSERDILAAEKHFSKRGRITTLLSKVFHGIGGVFQIAAGAVRMSLPEFFSFTLVGTLIKAFVLLMVGYYFGHAIGKIDSYLDLFAAGSLILLGGGVLFYLSKRFFRKN